MEMYAAHYPPGYDLPISTLFWGAVIFVALVAACFIVGNAVEGPRNRRKIRRYRRRKSATSSNHPD